MEVCFSNAKNAESPCKVRLSVPPMRCSQLDAKGYASWSAAVFASLIQSPGAGSPTFDCVAGMTAFLYHGRVMPYYGAAVPEAFPLAVNDSCLVSWDSGSSISAKAIPARARMSTNATGEPCPNRSPINIC
jgi:hypothetical protein